MSPRSDEFIEQARDRAVAAAAIERMLDAGA
jgi:hypothetical protein